MSVVCSIIALELAMKGDVVAAIIAFWTGIMIDAMIIDRLETLSTIGEGKNSGRRECK